MRAVVRRYRRDETGDSSGYFTPVHHRQALGQDHCLVVTECRRRVRVRLPCGRGQLHEARTDTRTTKCAPRWPAEHARFTRRRTRNEPWALGMRGVRIRLRPRPPPLGPEPCRYGRPDGPPLRLPARAPSAGPALELRRSWRRQRRGRGSRNPQRPPERIHARPSCDRGLPSGESTSGAVAPVDAPVSGPASGLDPTLNRPTPCLR